MKNFIKKLFGIDKIEAMTAQAEAKLAEAVEKAELALMAKIQAEEDARVAQLTPKDQATERGEPYISVLETKVNKDNVRNGFFELDWNSAFVLQLKEQGYAGDSEEEIVDKWFQDLCRNVGAEAGVDMERRGVGNVRTALRRDDGLTEIY